MGITALQGGIAEGVNPLMTAVRKHPDGFD
jgi:hypothetical protein